jgi:hypothetical protein
LEDVQQIIDEKLRQNRISRTAMLSSIISGETIAFVGAGLSVPLDFPLWEKLLKDLHAQATKLGPLTVSAESQADALRYADEIKAHFIAHNEEDRYYEILGRGFQPKASIVNHTPTHKLLVGLPFRGFVTPNYETCIESAILAAASGSCPDPSVIIKKDRRDRHRVSTFLRSLTVAGGPRYVAHLHGRFDDTRNMILAGKDYDEAYGIGSGDESQVVPEKTTLHRMLAWALFASRRMVFVACSMTDPSLRFLLKAVGRDLWEMSEKNHFVILPLGAKDLGSADATADMCDRHGLQVVYYDNSDDTHLGLDKLLSEATAMLPAPASAPAPAPAAPASTDPTAKGPAGGSGSASWLEEANQRNAPKLTE